MGGRDRRRRIGAAMIGLAAMTLASCSTATENKGAAPGTTTGTGIAATQTADTISLLYVQQGSSGTLTPRAGDGRDYSLQLSGLNPMTTWFSDRPQRQAGSMTSAKFVADWRGVGFVDDPPNAALVVTDASGAEKTMVVELRDPIYDAPAQRLRYRVRMLDAANEGLEFAKGRNVTQPEATFGTVSLFIDDANVPAAATSGAVTPKATTTTTTAPTATTGAPATTTTSGGAPSTTSAGGSTVGLCTFPGAIPMPTATATGAPAVTTQATGPLAPANTSPTLQSAYTQFLGLSCTHYQHSYTETPPTLYYYDCVGFTSYTVREATPQAWASVQQATGIGPGYVPTPGQYQQFFENLLTSPQTGWQGVPTAAAISPGDVLAWDPDTNNTSEAGHSVLALSTPQALGNGRYELIIMDSTATDHGPDDTRQSSNPLSQRNAPLGSDTSSGAPSADAASPTAPSGLGIGTIGLVTNSAGQVTGIEWTLGTAVENVTFGAGQPTS